ncbi:MAG: CocE/NonD family hydrolase [Chitinophagaceae bacterium]
MRKILLLALLTGNLNTFSQKIPFAKEGNIDSTALGIKMKALATQVIRLYRNENRLGYFDNIFRYQMVAQQFTAAMKNLDSIRQFTERSKPKEAKAIGFQFESFAAAREIQLQKKISFKEAYLVSFTSLYNNFSPEAQTVATNYLAADVAQLKESFYKLLKEQSTKDSIDLEDAMLLTRFYNSYVVYSQVIPLATPFITAQETKEFIIEDSVLIKTRDGSVIAATVIRKKNIVGKQPTIFVFNIYTSAVDKAIAKLSASKGYAGIVANTRGKRLSPQMIEPFEHDANDAYDIIEWISKQPWSNGKVGMYGGSYLGFSQWAAAKKVHPALKTIVPQVAVGIGIDYPMQNNIFMSYMLRWIHFVTNSKQTDNADFGNTKHWQKTFMDYYKNGRAFQSLDTIEGRPNNIFQRWLKHPSYDVYWQKMVPYKEDFAKIQIPVMTITGYYDDDQLGAMYYFEQHHLYNRNANHYLLIGPYNHFGAQDTPYPVLNGYTIDSVANINITDLAFKWFDYILKDSSKPAILKDKVNYQVMGTNQWKHAPSLSKMNNDTLTFYLSNVRVAADYKLDVKSSPVEFIRQEIDFKDRKDTIPLPEEINVIDSLLHLRNSLSFVSQTFDKPFEINGAFTGTLMASINKKDMDVSIQLYELMPDGKYFTLSNYLGRASYAKDKSKRQLLHAGKIESIPYNRTFFVSKKISAGSKLVVLLGVNKSADWQVNYGTGKDVSEETINDAKEPLEIKWYGSSSIKIPVYKY